MKKWTTTNLIMIVMIRIVKAQIIATNRKKITKDQIRARIPIIPLKSFRDRRSDTVHRQS